MKFNIINFEKLEGELLRNNLYLILSLKQENGFKKLYKSEIFLNNLNPEFKKFGINKNLGIENNFNDQT